MSIVHIYEKRNNDKSRKKRRRIRKKENIYREGKTNRSDVAGGWVVM